MLKIILVLCAVLAVAKGHADQASSYSIGTKYMAINQQQYYNVLRYFDSQLDQFTERYNTRLESILLLVEMTSASIVQTKNRIYPLEFLGKLGNYCVSKYRALIPDIIETNKILVKCHSNASALIDTLLSSSIYSRNSLEKHYVQTYEKRINDCSKQNYSLKNYTLCLTAVTENTNAETIKTKKVFAQNMEAAECAAKGYIKSAYDCIYTEQTRVSGELAKAYLLVNECMEDKDKCPPCEAPNNCLTMEVDANKKSIVNPFYGYGHSFDDQQQTCYVLHRSV